MSEIDVQFPTLKAARDTLRDLVTATPGVMIQSESVQDYQIHPFAKLNHYFDLDQLWVSEQSRGKLLKALEPLLRELDKSRPFNTIVPLLSSFGSLGPVPHTAILAERLKKRLVIFREFDFGRQYPYPGTARAENLLGGISALVVKDIAVRAASLRNVCSIIRDFGGAVSATLVFVVVDTNLRPALVEYLGEVGVPMVLTILNASELHIVPRPE